MSRLDLESGTALGDYSDEWWGEAIDRLVRYADIKIKRRRWMGLLGGDPPGGKEGQDIVFTVLDKVHRGQRRWDPVANPQLFRFLTGQVDSEISNLVRSRPNKLTVRISAEGDAPEPHRYPSEGLEDAAAGPEETALEKESTGRFWAFANSLDDEPELQEVVLAVLQGAARRSEVAEALKVTEAEVDNRRKRLRRRWRDYQSRAPHSSRVKEGESRRG